MWLTSSTWLSHARCACLQAYLNGIDVPGIFLFKTLIGKIVGSIGAVAGGLAIGKEGPFVHAGAAVGALLCQVGAWCCCGSAGAGAGAGQQAS